MTADSLRASIIDILAVISPDEDFENLKDSEPFRDQFSMDSMDMLDVVLELRRRFSLSIPEADYPNLVSMESSIKYLLPLLNEKEKANG